MSGGEGEGGSSRRNGGFGTPSLLQQRLFPSLVRIPGFWVLDRVAGKHRTQASPGASWRLADASGQQKVLSRVLDVKEGGSGAWIVEKPIATEGSNSNSEMRAKPAARVLLERRDVFGRILIKFVVLN